MRYLRFFRTATFIVVGAVPSVLAGQDIAGAVRAYDYGKYQQAADLFSADAGTSPGDANIRYWLGKTYIKLRKWDDAVKAMEKAVELAPNNSTYHLWLARAYGYKASHVNFFSAFGLARKAKKEFEAAMMLSPDDVEIRFDLLQYYAEAPGIVGGGKDKAEEQAKAIAGLNPRQGYSARAQIYEEDDKWDLARRQFVEATEKFPNDPDGFVDLADFLLQRKDYEGAARSARKALELEPGIRQAAMILAAAQAKLGEDVPAAVKMLETLAAGPLTDHDPSFETVYYWLGEAYIANGDTQSARTAFETSLKFDPDYQRSKDALSQIR